MILNNSIALLQSNEIEAVKKDPPYKEEPST
jgi:hypothetical protein